MKKILGVVVILIVVLGGLWLWSNNQNPTADDEPLKIGVILPLTGNLASLGENAKMGAELAVNNLPKDVMGKLELLIEDDRFDPKNTVSAFNKLADVDGAEVIVCFTSGPCGAVAPLAEQKQIPLIAISSAPVQQNKNWVVRLEISAAEEANRLLQYIREKNYTRVASIVAVQDGIQAGYETLSADADFRNREVFSDAVKPDEVDYKTPLAKILTAKPDVIFVGLLPGAAGIFGQQARTLGYAGDFLGFNFIEGEETLTAARGALDGIVYTQIADPLDWFSQKYRQAYSQSIGPGSAHLYDAISLVARAISEGRNDKTAINVYLRTVQDFSGAFGTYDSTGNGEFTFPLLLKTIRGGRFIKLDSDN